jgi:hypothetical protein
MLFICMACKFYTINKPILIARLRRYIILFHGYALEIFLKLGRAYIVVDHHDMIAPCEIVEVLNEFVESQLFHLTTKATTCMFLKDIVHFLIHDHSKSLHY